MGFSFSGLPRKAGDTPLDTPNGVFNAQKNTSGGSKTEGIEKPSD
jgi:hypothetical protein